MAEIWGAALVAGATVYSANRAGAAARAQGRGADAATAESARQYDQTRDDLASGRALYDSSNNALARLMGGQFDQAAYLRANPDVAKDAHFGTRPNEHYQQHGQMEGREAPLTAPDMSGFFASPDYEFNRNEGMRGIERSAAASGGAFSGNALRALTEFNGNRASSEFGNYFNRLTTAAGLGSAATNQTAAYGADAANNASRNHLYAGDARASGIENQANIIGQGVNALGGIAGYYSQNKKPPSAVGYYDINLGGHPRRM